MKKKIPSTIWITDIFLKLYLTSNEEMQRKIKMRYHTGNFFKKKDNTGSKSLGKMVPLRQTGHR